MKTPAFPAKLLLFGEYTIINGGSALAIPLWKFSGQWKEEQTGRNLNDFYEHLLTLEGSDISAIKKAKELNQTFQSSIPLGYGLGSSGSLSAAAYAAFFKKTDDDLKQTRSKLADIESFFHGKSSGMDPLTCYYQKPVYIKEGEINLLESLELPSQLKLLDSHKSRVSKPLIEHFKIRIDSEAEYEANVTALSRFNDRIIEELIAGKVIRSSFKEISSLQYELFIRMIPVKLRELWKKGLDTDQYYVKLSGAGGGGYFLVYENEAGVIKGLVEIG